MDNKIVIVFDGENEPMLVDELVLTLASPCFKKMMESGMTENKKRRIELKGKDRSEFAVLLSFLMPGTSRLPKITVNNADFLLALSNEFCIEHIKQECIDFIKIQPPSIDRVLQAHLYGFQDHLDSCIKQLLQNGLTDWGPCTANLELLQLVFKHSLAKNNEIKDIVFENGSLKHNNPYFSLTCSMKCCKCKKAYPERWECQMCSYK